MTEYQFNTELAEKYGVEAAVVIRHFVYWLTKNQVDKKNFKDGRSDVIV